MNNFDPCSIPESFRWYYENGYITQRDGNACFKITDSEFLVTPSGVQKQDLHEDHLLRVNNQAELLQRSSYKPSIETLAHIAVLNSTSSIASAHVHSLNTIALFTLASKMGFLPVLEKSFLTMWPELFRYTRIGKTVGYEVPGSHSLHTSIARSFSESRCDIVVLDRHGVITHGESMDECREHIQRLEHTSEIVLKMLMASHGNIAILE
jgi:ribulose-5-phosphate 4-epimerase/fuculose-1-phosphate aldolase